MSAEIAGNGFITVFQYVMIVPSFRVLSLSVDRAPTTSLQPPSLKMQRELLLRFYRRYATCNLNLSHHTYGSSDTGTGYRCATCEERAEQSIIN
jgi:hypothetical protein